MRGEGTLCGGFCRSCGEEHFLESRAARTRALELMAQLDHHGRIDFASTEQTLDERLLTAPLFGEARGKMLGVLLCRNPAGQEVVLRAFSGQFNGVWQVAGWVDPLFSVAAFHRLQDRREARIKALGRKMEQLDRRHPRWLRLRQLRRRLSRELMQEIFALYRVPDFRGREWTLAELFAGHGGIPTGTGDCCAPKLLAHAARARLTPLSLAEVFYGRDNLSGTCRHGRFYPPCTGRCAPLLGTMLCGAGSP